MKVAGQLAPEIPENGAARAELVPLLGASLLSAAGSLPLHLMPLIVVALIAETRTSVAEAGWVASALFLGQLSASWLLPVLKVDSVRRRFTIAASLVLISALLLTLLDGLPLLILGWSLVGACCGLLQYVGTATASVHARPVFAFSIRLGVVLVLAGTVAGTLQATNVLTSYGSILTGLCLIFAFVLSVGIALYRAARPQPKAPPRTIAHKRSLSRLGGLASAFLLMAGQTGFLAYAIQGAVGRGIALADAALALAGMKFVAGCVLLSIAHRGLSNKQHPRFLELGLLLGASIVVISYAEMPALFFLGFFSFEIALNFLSARLQGKVAETAPEFTGRWLTGTMLLGAASGPIVHGLLLNFGAGTYFLGFAVLSALIPALWLTCRRLRIAAA